ncbi:hypothetical protein MAR_014662 [Mya arenaria]|uniref:Uncharacterized protein n=1 Tax=Mya arenaria TaxID=6604 RepID=A0ABY7FET6_MYAAR|nr:hypothetical protein MAR_014662 [Mya arenaria]
MENRFTFILYDLSIEIQSSINNAVNALISKVIEGINLRLSDEIDSLKTENAHLKARISVVEKSEDRLEHLEQYSRRNGQRISGVCEREGGSTDDIVTKLVSDLGSTVSLDEIDRSYRVGRPRRNDPAKPRDIIVKFMSFRARQKLYVHKPSIAQILRSAWTSDGVILIRDNDMHLHRVTKARELDNFQSVTVPRTSPTSQRPYAYVLNSNVQRN